MSTKHKRRRAAQRGRWELVASDDKPLLLIGEPMPVDIAAHATIEAEADGEYDGDDDKPRKPPTFKTRAYSGGPMSPKVNGLGQPIPTVIDLAGARAYRNGRGTPVLFGHDHADPVGHTTRIDLGTTIDAEGVLSVPCDSRDKIVGGAAAGFRWAVSVGYAATEMEYLAQKETATVNGRTIVGPVYIARRGLLREISLLSIGADASATATVSATLASLEPSMNPELRAYIEAAGFNPDDITDAQVEFFRTQHAAKIEAAGDPEPNPKPKPKKTAPANVEAGAGDEVDLIAQMRAEAAAERQRIARVSEICAEYGNPSVTIQGKKQPLDVIAIEAGWTDERVELEALRASRPSAPAAHSTGRSVTHTIEAVNAGLMMRCGVDIEAADYRGRAMIEAGVPGWLNANTNDERFQRTAEAGYRFRHASLMDICATVAEIESGNRPHGNHQTILEAAFSTNAIATVFGTTVGARMLRAFREVPDTTAGWTTSGTVPDFEEHGRHGIDSLEQLDHLPAGGEATHAKRTAWKEIQSAARFAKQFQIDEQDIIGDRLGLLTTTPMKMGMAAGRMRGDLVYGLLLANPTMQRTGRAAFHTTDWTLLDPAAALAGPALSVAIASLMKQKDGDATLNLRPTHLITGAELIDTAVQLLGSAELSNDSGKGSRNPIARYGIQPVGDARISNGVIHPKTKTLQTGSATAWFLVSADGETIEVVTVEGTGGVPVVMTTNLRGVGKFGIQVETKYDIGANFMENRTFRKNAGA